VENTISRGVQFMKNAKKYMDLFGDKNGPSIIFEFPEIYKNNYIECRKRGGKIRFITEITKDNIRYCKELVDIVDEFRHLEGFVGGIAISESEFMTTTSLRNKQLLTQIFYSNAKEVVDQGQYIFNTFWNKATPAEQRFREIEEGVEPIATKVLKDSDEIFGYIKHVMENSSSRQLCSSTGAMQIVFDNFLDYYKRILERHKKGEGTGIQWITSIDSGNRELVEIFLSIGVQVRHLRNLPPMNFAVDGKHFHATIENMEDGKLMHSLLTSNDPIYVSHYSAIFNELWKNGIDAEQRIRDIDNGTDLADIEVFQNASRTKEVYLDIVKKATKEILFVFPTTNSFSRQYKIGAMELAKSSVRKHDSKIRILMPENNISYKLLQQLKEEIPGHIDIRYIEQMSDTKSTILVIDRKKSLVMELRDDSKTVFEEAIGLSTYSNSKAGVLSYVAIFENLWKQTELYQDIKEAHELLKIHDKMQKEFINIAAHELRTPPYSQY
jgi:hypothetical protein